MLRNHLVSALTVLTLALATAPPMLAESDKRDSKPPSAVGPAETIHVEVRLQQLFATVKNPAGNMVPGLRPEDFTIEENGVRQTIAYFSPESDTPITLGILIDRSLSMADQQGAPWLSAAKGAARALVRLGKPGDEFLLMAFNDSFRLEQDFTADPNLIERRLADITADGKTKLYEAVKKALDKMKKAKHAKRALVIITDTLDNEKGMTLSKLQDTINQEEIRIYTIGVFRGGRWAANGSNPPMNAFQRSMWENLFGPHPAFKNVMETFAAESGGRSIALNVNDLSSEETVMRMALFAYNLSSDLRGQYMIGYYPQQPGPAGTRAIAVRSVSPNHAVQTRRGPLAPLHNSAAN